jgi:[ribosomal protein S5]-alanine N-acetyltransferase
MKASLVAERFLDSSTPHREAFTHPEPQTVSRQDLDQRAWASQLATLKAAAEGTQDPWLIMYGADVVGRVTLSNIARGMFLSANIGYWTDFAHTGRGLATEAVGFAVLRADELGLHRVEAGTLALNLASQRVLLKCGFERVGLAREYLFIAGQWQDHEVLQRILNNRPA